MEVYRKGKKLSNGNLETKKDLDINKKNLERQINLFVITIIIIIVLAFCSVIVIQKFRYARSHFNFHGFNYTIMNYAKKGKPILIYHTNFTLNPKWKSPVVYNLYLYNDPRQIEHLETNSTFRFTKLVYLSFQPDVKCKGMSLISIKLSQFLNTIGIIVDGAVLYNSSEVDGRKVNIINCSTTNATVIQILMTNRTIISTSKNGTCINLEFSDCSYASPIAEAFLLSLIDKMSGYKKSRK